MSLKVQLRVNCHKLCLGLLPGWRSPRNFSLSLSFSLSPSLSRRSRAAAARWQASAPLQLPMGPAACLATRNCAGGRRRHWRAHGPSKPFQAAFVGPAAAAVARAQPGSLDAAAVPAMPWVVVVMWEGSFRPEGGAGAGEGGFDAGEHGAEVVDGEAAVRLAVVDHVVDLLVGPLLAKGLRPCRGGRASVMGSFSTACNAAFCKFEPSSYLSDCSDIVGSNLAIPIGIPSIEHLFESEAN